MEMEMTIEQWAAKCGRLESVNADLLAALEIALDRFTDSDMIPPNYALSKWIEQARAAIRKAKGE